MGDKIITMDEKYRQKHYPKGFFAELIKQAKGGGVALVICGVILALMGGGLLWLLVSMMLENALDYSEDMSVVIVLAIIGLILLIPGILLVRYGIKRGKTTEEDWIKTFVEASNYPESTIRDFVNQSMEDGSLKLALGANRMQGFLTRDYFFILNFVHPCVMKIEDIVGAYLVQTTYTANINGRSKRMYSNNIMLISNKKTTTSSEASEKTVRQLQEMLVQKNPEIETQGGRMLSEKEFDEKVKALFGEA